jgi:hypothetical protein
MSAKKHFTKKQAREIGDKLAVDWDRVNLEQFHMGLDVELEHGLQDPLTDVTGDDPILTGKIALAHINEFKDYYTRLDKMEREAREDLGPIRRTEGTIHHSISSIIGFEIRASDGDLGQVDEFYFDDANWIIRYMIVETGDWLSGRKVLISPVAFGKLDPESRMIAVNLTSAQVSGSPDIDTQRPIHRQQEVALHEHYQWPWRGGYGGVFGLTPLPLSFDDVPVRPKVSEPGHRDDPHLRSSRQVSGYRIHAIDGEIGHVADFIVEDESWAIRFLVVDTGNWLPGKKVLLSPHWINRVEWADGSVHFDLTRESIKDSPEFDPARTVYRDYEACLCGHYGRPVKVFGAVKIPKATKRVKAAKKSPVVKAAGKNPRSVLTKHPK